jgi:hypothetical protein
VEKTRLGRLLGFIRSVMSSLNCNIVFPRISTDSAPAFKYDLAIRKKMFWQVALRVASSTSNTRQGELPFFRSSRNGIKNRRKR